MELVYLWVEDYNNIHKQGFNFSPRFECEFYPDYDERGQLTDESKLDICDKKGELAPKCKDSVYIENFFGENINVTAIVGKNGSGKSSVLNLINDLLTDIKPPNYDRDNYTPYIGIIRIEEKFYIFKNKVIFKADIKYEYITKEQVKLYSFNKDKIPNETYDINSDLINVNNNHQELLKSVAQNKYIFDTCVFSIKVEPEDYSDLVFSKELMDSIKKYYDKLSRRNIMKKNFFRSFIKFMNNELLKTHIEGEKQAIELSMKKFIDCLGYDLQVDEVIIDKELKNILEIKKYYNQDNYDSFKKNFDNYIQAIHELNELKDKFNKRNKGDKQCEYLIDINNEDELNSVIHKLYELRNNILTIDFINRDTKVKYSDLSDGEKNILRVILKIIVNIKDKTLFIADEIDNYLHPTWKKELIAIIVKTLQYFKDTKNHFIITTHSPFLLSDIPKQNIIFLDKDENGNCKVVDGPKEKKQTFGANIHTLLSDSFFMEDGLMGEFAKGKIDEVIKLLNKEKLDEKELKYCEQIISIVGEPIVKNQLQRMLDSKRLKKVDEIDAIKRSMKAMQKRLDELEK